MSRLRGTFRSRLWPRLLGGLIAAFVLIQLVPYGRAHTDPPVTASPQWANATTEALFVRACADCHSNNTVWPWYSNIAPVSWLVQRHVDEGRSKFNINAPGFGRNANEAAKQVRSGKMPEPTYLPLHPEARLSTAELEQLAQGLAATFGDEAKGKSQQGKDSTGD